MKFKFLNFLILIFVLSFLVFPLAVSAVDFLPLVPCGISEVNEQEFKAKGQGQADWDYTRPCTRCDSFRLVKNVIDFIFEGIVPPVAAVLFIAGGFIILLAGARPEWISTGRAIFWNTFIGLIIIFASWMIVNTLIKSFGPDQVKSSWNKFVCEDAVITGPGGPGNICFRPQELAQQNGAYFPQPRTDTTWGGAPELNQLISCVNSKLSNFIDQSQIYTYEIQNPLCNYTKGQSTCGSCKHTVNSCHYGGPNGSGGSLAVDFNAQGISEQELFNRLSAIRNECNFGFIKFETNHTHVSTVSCTGDTGGD